ncbi:hypothetical protein BS47DRAFT_773947 [Hydnum rufescens UP504]|uniref:Uncharacterized protein n=1 Tax=Hydnum rufescens UP504 TaxID=1448309 RepID=A0A9P6B272_9AGAM|nr:hypothetical protein BS47DRAFT_773947 [Hydnum rufescens UP504]
MFHYLQHEFDQASHKELAAMRSAGPIRSRVSMFFSGPNRFHHWVEEDKYRRQAEDIGKHESVKDRTEIPFLRHPDRAGFGLLLTTCAASSTSPAGFANQPDGVLFFVCLRLLLLISDWRTQIEEDSSLRDDFYRFIDEFSSIPSHRTLATLRPDIREAYTITMSYVYLFSVTSDGVYMIPALRTETVGNHIIRSIPQYIDYLEREDYLNDSDLNAFLPLVTYLVPFQDELEELIRVDILSVLVRIFRRQQYVYTRPLHSIFNFSL